MIEGAQLLDRNSPCPQRVLSSRDADVTIAIQQLRWEIREHQSFPTPPFRTGPPRRQCSRHEPYDDFASRGSDWPKPRRARRSADQSPGDRALSFDLPGFRIEISDHAHGAQGLGGQTSICRVPVGIVTLRNRTLSPLDNIASSIVGAIEPQMRTAETRRAISKPTTSLQAYDHFLRALRPSIC